MPSEKNLPPTERYSVDWPLYICIALLSTLVCFVHLSNFSLSIDEELASFSKGNAYTWIAQGRWGMAVVQMLIPYSSAIPFISTLIFILTISAASLVFALQFSQNRCEKLVFASFFVTSPIWLHVIEFNTLAAGAGIGLLVTALAVNLLSSRRAIFSICAGLCVGFAIGVYQALVSVYIVCCIAMLFRKSFFWPQRVDTSPKSFKQMFKFIAISLVVAFGFYFLTQRVFLALTHQHSEYTDSWIQVDSLRTNFRPTALRILKQIKGLLFGTDSTYLGWGRPLLILPAIGFIYGIYHCVTRGPSDALRSIASLLALALMILASSILVIMAAGHMPTRALIGFPMIFAFLALNGYRFGKGAVKLAQWTAYVYAMLISAWIGASLFYADTVARERDQLLATQLASAIETTNIPTAENKIPFVLIGERNFSGDGVAAHVQIFGTSFFEQDGGNPYRVAAYMKILGVNNLQPEPITAISGYLNEVKQMPSWPTKGAVTFLGKTLVIKLGNISYQQQLLLNSKGLAESG